MDTVPLSTMTVLSALAVAGVVGAAVATVLWRGGGRAQATPSTISSGRVRLPARALERLALLSLALATICVIAVVDIRDAARHDGGLAAACLTAVAALCWLVRRGGFMPLRAGDTEQRGPDHG